MNVSNSTNFYNATGFTEGTSHEIGTHTVDILGNINSAWENHTALTSDNTPPASITALSNTPGDHWIEWTWTNPGLDFNYTIIYINGVFEKNISVPTYNYTNIASSTSFNISIKTVDASGNINATWVNNTATTLADTTPPGNVIGLTATTGIDWIKWTWTNPSDFDFNHTMISIDGGTAVNQSTTFYNATGLTSSASYTINIKTVDTTGRINSPGISNSSTTLSKTFYTGNLIWDALSSPSPVYTWTARSYSGFYYDLDSDMGSETLTITQAGGSVASGGLVYTTAPINTKFEHTAWGSYQVTGFMAEKYFAGYPVNTFGISSSVDLMSKGQLSKVLIDRDQSKSIYSGAGLILEMCFK
jgi:hypothetical protein